MSGQRAMLPLGDHYLPAVANSAWIYQVSPLDGRLLILRTVPGSEHLAPIKVVVNWFEELKRLIPTH
jgi:hypothetical protein